ncbi:methyltransferase, FkbM family [Filimonas lacunae]|uniref:Methyltransferase, FkbM family n=1 Tax=Filimonas lacunae TaxID=477680 RepID=A0A173MHU9_9BACT|nr:FkbM family methyltransferase [Filimonas lacunae]BAV07194.1 methyltransferase, FkbM family domain protein [Filimonas lacunae]SIS93461.1 methyltransferase, FkbM family [Filimonas lacunae]
MWHRNQEWKPGADTLARQEIRLNTSKIDAGNLKTSILAFLSDPNNISVSKLLSVFKSKYSKVGYSKFRVKRLRSLPNNKIHAVPFLDGTFYLKNSIEFLHGVREIFINDIYKQKLPDNAVVLDCGSHIGLSVLYIKKLCPGARVTAFEPDSVNFSLLQKNVESYGLSHVNLQNKAVWIENTTLQFTASNDMGSHIEANATAGNTVAVEAVRLRDMITDRVHFLKIDIEGAEYAVIKDIADKLPLVDNLFLEFHGSFADAGKLAEMLTLLAQYQFTFYIEEATKTIATPFFREAKHKRHYDIQLDIHCFKL